MQVYNSSYIQLYSRPVKSKNKTTLEVDKNKWIKYIFVAYTAWVFDFQQIRKVIYDDVTFLKIKYRGVSLWWWHRMQRIIFFIDFCVVDKEGDETPHNVLRNAP